MTLSPMAAEIAAAYEQEHGQMPTERALQVAEHIEKVSRELTSLGRKDAQEDKGPYSSKVFMTLVAAVFHLDPEKDHETVQTIADLWQFDYMDGYQEGGAV